MKTENANDLAPLKTKHDLRATGEYHQKYECPLYECALCGARGYDEFGVNPRISEEDVCMRLIRPRMVQS